MFLPALACDAPRRSVPVAAPPPAAEFLLATADSTFWVRTTPDGIRAHGAPLLLANYGGRFYEIFVADDDRSYEDALLVGQRLYRRDLAGGDSVVLFADTIVPRLAGTYARAHPSERPLKPEEDVRENPHIRATAEVDVLDVHGPYLSFQYHADVAQPGGSAWHTTRHGVLDLRSGRSMAVADLFGDAIAERVLRVGRVAFQAALDTLRAREGRGDSRVGRAANTLSRFTFDARSFALAAVDSTPAVEFAATGRGSQDEEGPPPLPPVPAGDAPWWREALSSLPSADAVGAVDRWRQSATPPTTGYDVLARYDSLGETAHVALADGRHEWPVASVAAPVNRIFWLDRTPIDSAQRRGLVRAFSEASLYDETTRSVRDAHRPETTLVLTTVASSARAAARHTRSTARMTRAIRRASRGRS